MGAIKSSLNNPAEDTISLHLSGSYADLYNFLTRGINQKRRLKTNILLDKFLTTKLSGEPKTTSFRINELLCAINEEIFRKGAASKTGISNPHVQLVKHILLLKPRKIRVVSIQERMLKKILELTEEHLSNADLTVDFLAREAGMSKTQLYRKLRSLTGHSPNEFIRHVRLHRANELLKQKAGYVAEIAYQVGYTNMSYFSKCFKNKYGYPPSEYLKSSSVLTGNKPLIEGYKW